VPVAALFIDLDSMSAPSSPSRRRSLWLAAAVAVLCWFVECPVSAQAARVLVLGRDGRAVVRDDPFLATAALTPAPAGGGPRAPARGGAARAQPLAEVADLNVRTELARLRRIGAISTAAYRHYLGSFNSALGTVRRLGGTRAAELESVIENLHGIAAAGLLTPSRLPALFLTLDRNRRWWASGPLLSPGQRVQFSGSQLVWEYYPGQGIELQELGSWGQADWMYEAGPHYWPRLRNLVDELIPLGARRGGALVWEYYFNFDGGIPPWTSAMSQGTAVQALTQTYEAFDDPYYLALARSALPIFTDDPPVGVGVPTPRGERYLLYSFDPAPGDEVINGFLQTLIGLFDYAIASGDPEGWRLFHAGDAEARHELPSYDTGSWSLYQPGVEDTLDYHVLVTGFLEQLCARTHAKVYCRTAAQFESYLRRPPPTIPQS
jgi:D-glucuronyl C5-epimerase-like protein